MPDVKAEDARRCNRCGGKADLGMTCSGPRCRQCGCDRPRERGRFSEEHGAVPLWGPLYAAPSEESRRLWGPLTPAVYEDGRNEWADA